MQHDNFKNTPSADFYGLFQFIFDFYNFEIFKGDIKNCIIVITRQKSVAGHYCYERWFSAKDKEIDELAINPSLFVKSPLMEICQTVVHEMCHAWQFHFGKPSRKGYHNKEWANKMIEIGLMPTTTGEPGGKIVGQSMSDYPIKDGLFLKVTEELMNSEIFAGLYYEVNPDIVSLLTDDKPLYDQIKNLTLVSGQLGGATKPKKSKVKYSCGCSNVWGKPGLEMNCKMCGNDYLEV